jgi:hypothetical protein
VKVLITGSRNWDKVAPIAAMMTGLNSSETEFIFGDCSTGVDAHALQITKMHKLRFKKFDANWAALGKAAGPTRNGAMVKYCKQSGELCVCFAFRSEGPSEGTDDCVYQANVAGIPTYVMRKMPDLAETNWQVPGINFQRKAKNHGK